MVSRTSRTLVTFASLSVALLAGCGGVSPTQNFPLLSQNHITQRPAAEPVHIWATERIYNKLFGLSADAKTILTVIDTDKQPVPATDPESLKVDDEEHLWLSSLHGDRRRGDGVIQEYVNGSYADAYVPTCVIPSCSAARLFVSDVAVDPNYVFAILDFIGYYEGSGYHYGTGYEYWPNGDPSATPNWFFMNTESQYGCNHDKTVCSIESGDVDRNGNLWVTDDTDHSSKVGLAEITDPAGVSGSTSFTQIEPLGTYKGSPESDARPRLYISDHGTVLNVDDAIADKIYQYRLPVPPSGAPFNTLTPSHCALYCTPKGFGFSRDDEHVVVADGAKYVGSRFGWLDIGDVKTGRWEEVFLPEFTHELSAAAYTPSDK